MHGSPRVYRGNSGVPNHDLGRDWLRHNRALPVDMMTRRMGRVPCSASAWRFAMHPDFPCPGALLCATRRGPQLQAPSQAHRAKLLLTAKPGPVAQPCAAVSGSRRSPSKPLLNPLRNHGQNPERISHAKTPPRHAPPALRAPSTPAPMPRRPAPPAHQHPLLASPNQ
jgi:hypothetical protein